MQRLPDTTGRKFCRHLEQGNEVHRQPFLAGIEPLRMFVPTLAICQNAIILEWWQELQLLPPFT
jgi:hypothetical protein